MIEVRIKGVTLTKQVRVDAEGFSVFTLDPARFQIADVIARTFAQCGAPADTKLSAMRWEAMLKARKA
jgi:hypothetical protein